MDRHQRLPDFHDEKAKSEDNEEFGTTHDTDRHQRLPDFDDEITMMMLANCNCDTTRCSCTSHEEQSDKEEEEPETDTQRDKSIGVEDHSRQNDTRRKQEQPKTPENDHTPSCYAMAVENKLLANSKVQGIQHGGKDTKRKEQQFSKNDKVNAAAWMETWPKGKSEHTKQKPALSEHQEALGNATNIIGLIGGVIRGSRLI